MRSGRALEVLTSMMQTYYRVLGMPITPDVAQKITDGDIGIIWTATKGFWFESTMLQAQRMRATPVQSEQFTVEPSLDLICHIHSLVYFRQPLLHHHILQTPLRLRFLFRESLSLSVQRSLMFSMQLHWRLTEGDDV